MPYRREFKLRVCSNSKLEELKCRYYKDLREGEDRISGSRKYFRCPYCQGKRGKKYDMQRLLKHSYRIGYASKSSSLSDKARHLGLLKYLERRRYAKSNARHPSPSDPSTNGANEETFVWPWMGIVANIPVLYKDGKFVDESGQKLKMELVAKGYNPVKVYTLLADRGFSGYAIVEFNSNFSGFANAMAFAWEFELDKHGKQEWYSSLKDESDDNLYAWIAGKEEYNSNSIVGNYLRRNGDLRTISEIRNENRKENSQLFSNLINELGLKYKECEEMEKMISETEVLMGNVMKEKEEMLSMHNKELEMIHQEGLKQVETILSEQETSKQQLDDHEKELKLREDEIRQREKLNESEKMKLDCEKEMNERAILAQTKVSETMMKLADELKREKEQALVKIFRLERELDQKQALELEVEKLKGLVKVRRHMMERGLAARNKCTPILEELIEKLDGHDHLENMTYELTIKHRHVDDQVQEARKEMINDDWMVIQTHATFTAPHLLTGCGGIMHNNKGDWVGGFSCSMKANNAADGEAWAVYTGLNWAWNAGKRKVCILSDAKEVVLWVNKGPIPQGPCGKIIQHCKDLMIKDWEVIIGYIPSDLNTAADEIAKLAPRIKCDWIEFRSPPLEIMDQLETDRAKMAIWNDANCNI
ncbi:PREDICTED: factor of DNA methylation 4-like [Ipomoea nil]|uniref:factor of DNA methylation 4-like n=1 Tax=Ipomoea nil TaxID=35883 RepID=UPI000900CB08|nr:PREDICTED: factor of DNA methylation 4-like [Ipomoea nil]